MASSKDQHTTFDAIVIWAYSIYAVDSPTPSKTCSFAEFIWRKLNIRVPNFFRLNAAVIFWSQFFFLSVVVGSALSRDYSRFLIYSEFISSLYFPVSPNSADGNKHIIMPQLNFASDIAAFLKFTHVPSEIFMNMSTRGIFNSMAFSFSQA